MLNSRIGNNMNHSVLMRYGTKVVVTHALAVENIFGFSLLIH